MDVHAIPEIPLIAPGDDLAAIIIDALDSSTLEISDGDILVLAQKKACKSLIPITLQIVRRTSHGIRSGTVPQLRGGPLNKTPALC